MKAQDAMPLLSEKHITKIQKADNPVTKARIYQRFFRKDSIKQEKRMIRHWRNQSDSMSDAMESRQKALAIKSEKIKDGINSKIYNTVYKPWATNQADKHILFLDRSGFRISVSSRRILHNYLVRFFLDASQNDSSLYALNEHRPDLLFPKQLSNKINNYKAIHAVELRQIANGKLNGLKNINGLKSLQAKGQRYTGELKKYDQFGKVLTDPESQKSFIKEEGSRLAKEYVGEMESSSKFNAVKSQLGEEGKLKGLQNDYKGKMDQLQDSANIKNQAKKKAEDLAMQYVADHPEVMQGVQRKMSLLMKKYSVVPNSNDLSSAVKRTSLRGKTFFEHLQVAANFQVISIDPFSIDFAPQAGYKINSRWVVGAGGLYRKTFTDSIPSLAADVLGYKAYSNYEILGNFFVTGEYARNSPGVTISEGRSIRQWENTLLAGVGCKFLIHPKVEMTLMAGYNFLHSNSDTIYPRPWVIRVGFQTSELAFLNKKRMQAANLR